MPHGDLPWGVGILGFAPPEVREAQLEAIKDVRPAYALIAGGRPSQAAALEEAGIETFLHVPSPGLLDRFLKDGTRRFVFEGSECGGHIGPRASFALWEAQIGRLLQQPDLDGVRVWFAGGVHDERSAAMVAAMAAPLAERGADVSVLMGTAYLFTEQAVRDGAIVPPYQRVALDCAATALLESSPGHVIRCADTLFVSAFAEAKRMLADEGFSQQEAWSELERLSLGRLRIAARGLRRDGETLVTVDEETARANGMYMLGQVAALRTEVTTIAALHEQVTVGATSFLGVTSPAYLVGNSYGGLIAARMAVSAPERVAGLLLIESACSGPGATSWIEDMVNTLTATALSMEYNRLPERLRAAGRRKVARLAAQADALLNGTSLIEDLAAEQPLDPAELARIGCPVLGVYGERSELAEGADVLRRCIPGCTVEIMPGLAHTVLREATGLLRGIVLDWLPQQETPG